jgi:hypothetical protein
MPTLNIETLKVTLTQTRARWEAMPTEQSKLSDAAKQRLLGVVVDPAALAAAMRPSAAAAPNFAQAIDWRNHNGNGSHVTPVKDQGACGSCVSFCTAATVESMASIEKGRLLDLAEADLHFCSSHGASCGGWWPDEAIEQVRTRGIPDEACFPYATAFQPPAPNPRCLIGPNRDSRAVKITKSGTLANIVDRKNYLSNNGPCCAVFHVFNDFFSYSRGVYHHVTGADMGLHCVEIIGYSEAEQCWICKNSWGTGWGDSGFFRIAYGEAGIDSEFPFWTAQGVVLPRVSPSGVPPAVGEPFGYAFINETTGLVEQHNLFRSADGHIHALWFNFTEGWHHEDRTTLLPGVPPAVGEPFGYAFINETTGLVEQHNLFRSADGHIHALWFNFTEGWHHEDRSL